MKGSLYPIKLIWWAYLRCTWNPNRHVDIHCSNYAMFNTMVIIQCSTHSSYWLSWIYRSFYSFCDRIELRVFQISMLSNIASCHPQSGFSTFTNGFSNILTYLSCTCPGINRFLQPLKDAISLKFISASTGRDSLNSQATDLLSLSFRLGGLAGFVQTLSQLSNSIQWNLS